MLPLHLVEPDLLREFGECPRMLCKGQAVIPMGVTDEPKLGGNVKLYCPKCRDVYNCVSPFKSVDGAFFGPTFPNLFFMTYEDLVPEKSNEEYVPRVFGFRISLKNNDNYKDGNCGAGNSVSSSGGGQVLKIKSGSGGGDDAAELKEQGASDFMGMNSTKKIIELREVSAADMASAVMKRQLSSTSAPSVIRTEEKEIGDTDVNGKRQRT